MKKLLLSILSIIAVAGMARAEVTLKVNDATDIKGTLVAEKPAEGTSNGEAEKYQPLESAKIGDYTFTFVQGEAKNAPALYKVMSGKEGAWTFRFYNGSSMTITAPEGTKMSQIDFDGQFKSFKATVSTGEVASTSNSAAVWKGSAEAITISASSSIRVSALTIYTGDETPDTPDVPDTPVTESYNYTLAKEIVSGQSYAIFASDTIALCQSGKNFGYLYGEEVKVAENAFTAGANAAFTFTAVDGGYTIQDSEGRYVYMKGTYNSFNYAATLEEASEGAVWSVEIAEDGTATIVNVAKEKTVMFGLGYHSFGAYPEANSFRVMPSLYLKGEPVSGISAVEIEQTNGEAVYYNLQGVRVNSDALTPGIYVRRQGNKAVKVLIR